MKNKEKYALTKKEKAKETNQKIFFFFAWLQVYFLGDVRVI